MYGDGGNNNKFKNIRQRWLFYKYFFSAHLATTHQKYNKLAIIIY